MSGPTIVQRRPFGRDRRIACGVDAIAIRGGTRDGDIAFSDVRRVRLSRTWMGLGTSHLRCTIRGTTRRVTVSCNGGSPSSPEAAAFAAFVAACLDRLASVRPEAVVVVGMSRAGRCLWLGTFGIALAGVVGALATLADGDSLLGALPAVFALLAGLPACWKNLVEAPARPIGAGQARAALPGFL